MTQQERKKNKKDKEKREWRAKKELTKKEP
jgi:hypothetical protein